MSQFWSALVHKLTPYVPGEQPRLPGLIKLNTNENPYPPSPHAVAAIREELGADGYVYGTLSGLDEDARLTAPQITARTHARSGTHRGSKIRLMPDLTRMHVFNDTTQDRIS